MESSDWIEKILEEEGVLEVGLVDFSNEVHSNKDNMLL